MCRSVLTLWAAPRFTLVDECIAAPGDELSFFAAEGFSYIVEGSADLINWQAIDTAVTGGDATVDRSYQVNGTLRFFRLRRTQ